MKIRLPLLALSLGLALAVPGGAQTAYHNVVNQRFNTVSNGPMQAEVVDVANPSDSSAVWRAVANRVNRSRAARETTLLRELQYMQQRGLLKKGLNPGIPDIVVLRQSGRLAVPQIQRTRAGGDITFAFVAQGQPGSFTPDQQAQLQTIINIVYPELKNVYGDPSWTGTVTIVNGDNQSPVISDRNALSGGIYNVSTQQITFAVYNAVQTKVLNLTQMMALAFRGPASISYDAWERGMARAATMVTVRNVLPLLNQAFGNGTVDVADPLWHAVDRYDLLNQPPLGNDRFFPVSLDAQPVNPSSLAGMLVPRLQMAGSAWLKVVTEVPSFFHDFNGAYYTALAGNPSLKNSVPDLKALAATVAGTVEGLPFTAWYDRQYILDTSVAVGDKLYAWPFALRPDPGQDDYGIGVVLVYYRTTFDAGSNSNEVNLGGTSYPIYWDYTFTNRLFLASQYERVDIRDGLGTVAPTFFNTIGGDPNTNGQMRIAMDFPVNNVSARLYVAPRSSGHVGDENRFWGTVVGANDGTIRIDADGLTSGDVPVKQGAFGAKVDAQLYAQPRRATITFTSGLGGGVVRRVNTGYNELIPVIYFNDPVTSLTHTFQPGPAIVTFPIQPLKSKASDALVDPATDAPLFNDGNLLLAEWKQSLTGTDKYLRYPATDPIRPGQGFWSFFPTAVTAKITGKAAAQDSDVSVGLLHGWNQIGSPYDAPVELSALQFQYLADNVPVDLAGAVSRGWIVATDVPQLGSVAVWGFSPSSGYVPASRLEPWAGYFIRVLVSEGLTITYPNPSRAAGRAAGPLALNKGGTRSTRSGASGWALPLYVKSQDGAGASAWLGQAATASAGFNVKRDALLPPAPSRSVPAISFPHADWGDNAGDYYSDVKPLGSRDPWEITVYTPDPTRSYSLTWGDLTNVPRNLRLVLVDKSTGHRQYLQNSSTYQFTPGSSPTRSFQIQVENRSMNGLRVMNVTAQQSRAAGLTSMQISYELTAGAEVQTDIRDASGRVIRRLNTGRAATAGVNQLLWDTKDDRAVAVPAGTYTVQITAHTPEGDSARVVQPVLVLR